MRPLNRIFHFFPDIFPRVRFLGRMGALFLGFSRNLHAVFHNDCTNLHFHKQHKKVPFSLHPLQSLSPVDFLMMAILTGVEVIPHCGIALHFKDFKWIFQSRICALVKGEVTWRTAFAFRQEKPKPVYVEKGPTKRKINIDAKEKRKTYWDSLRRDGSFCPREELVMDAMKRVHPHKQKLRWHP